MPRDTEIRYRLNRRPSHRGLSVCRRPPARRISNSGGKGIRFYFLFMRLYYFFDTFLVIRSNRLFFYAFPFIEINVNDERTV